MKHEWTPIGIIRSPYKDLSGMPIQAQGISDVSGSLVIDEPFAAGLTDIEGFSHIILLYLFHRSSGYRLQVKPFLDDREHGVFATRAPRRPNPIGISVVRLVSRRHSELRVEGVDVVDQTPLLDIKPYVPAFDVHEVSAIGWLKGKDQNAKRTLSDERFRA